MSGPIVLCTPRRRRRCSLLDLSAHHPSVARLDTSHSPSLASSGYTTIGAGTNALVENAYARTFAVLWLLPRPADSSLASVLGVPGSDRARRPESAATDSALMVQVTQFAHSAPSPLRAPAAVRRPRGAFADHTPLRLAASAPRACVHGTKSRSHANLEFANGEEEDEPTCVKSAN
ncbi:hypothetical protein DFH06DRAFT_1348685 [Mycena polygramma]|nr:hypothetical protein DFH06DRAFT_1348685 [Mycena polygramma]